MHAVSKDLLYQTFILYIVWLYGCTESDPSDQDLTTKGTDVVTLSTLLNADNKMYKGNGVNSRVT